MKAIHFFIKLTMLTALFSLFSIQVLAQEITIVDVRRNITLSDDDTVYKDYYLNSGDNSGLKKNLIVNIKRKIHVRDMTSKNIGDFETIVGQLKIIHVGQKVSVAREYKLISRDEEAMVEQIGIMAGDQVDLNGAFIDNTKPAKKSKTAEVNTSNTEETKTADLKTEKAEEKKTTADAGAVINLQPINDQAKNAGNARDPAAQATPPGSETQTNQIH